MTPRFDRSAAWHAGIGTLAFAILFALIIIGVTRKARAEWKPEYDLLPPEIRAWYRNAELTPEAQARLPFKKCCDHADVVKTKFSVNKTNNGDEWFYLAGSGWRRIPDDVIHWGESAPGGQPTLFVYSGAETCFFPGDGGI